MSLYQSRPRKVGKSGPAARSLAFTRRPLAGEVVCGRAVPWAQPIQSERPSLPWAGNAPSPLRRIGIRPVTKKPMVWVSATSRFNAGEVICSAVAPASATDVARFNASRPTAAPSPGARLDIASASIGPALGDRSLMTGPWRVSRTFMITLGCPRTAITSVRVTKGRGPSSVW